MVTFYLTIVSQVLGPRPQSRPHGGPEVHLGRLRLPAGHDRTRHHQAAHRKRLAAGRLRAADAVPVLRGRSVSGSPSRRMICPDYSPAVDKPAERFTAV